MKMSKWNKVMFAIFLTGIPLGLIGTWIFKSQNWAQAMPLAEHPMAGFLAMGYLIFITLWAFVVLVFLGRLIFSTQFRETVLKMLLFMKNRDEREELISQKAAQSSYLFTMGVVVVMLLITTENVLIPTSGNTFHIKTSVTTGDDGEVIKNTGSSNMQFHAPGVRIFSDTNHSSKGQWMIFMGNEELPEVKKEKSADVDEVGVEYESIRTEDGKVVKRKTHHYTIGADSLGHKFYLTLILLSQLGSYFYFARRAEKAV